MAFSILDVPPLSFSFDGTDEKAILVLGPVSIGNNQIGTFSNFLQFELSKSLRNVFVSEM